MHELSIAQSILDLVGEHVPAERQADVGAVRVRVGRLSGVSAESLAFCFTALAGGTTLGRARLVVEDVPVRLHCASCRATREVEWPILACPACGGAAPGAAALVSGRELDLVAIEVTDGDGDETAAEAS